MERLITDHALMFSQQPDLGTKRTGLKTSLTWQVLYTVHSLILYSFTPDRVAAYPPPIPGTLGKETHPGYTQAARGHAFTRPRPDAFGSRNAGFGKAVMTLRESM